MLKGLLLAKSPSLLGSLIPTSKNIPWSNTLAFFFSVSDEEKKFFFVIFQPGQRVPFSALPVNPKNEKQKEENRKENYNCCTKYICLQIFLLGPVL